MTTTVTVLAHCAHDTEVIVETSGTTTDKTVLQNGQQTSVVVFPGKAVTVTEVLKSTPVPGVLDLGYDVGLDDNKREPQSIEQNDVGDAGAILNSDSPAE